MLRERNNLWARVLTCKHIYKKRGWDFQNGKNGKRVPQISGMESQQQEKSSVEA